MCEFDKEIEDLHAERSSLLASFCEFLAALFGDCEPERRDPAD
jgi:hypothetical protein